MFKRILKVIGFVLLGFVLLIGGVVGFMAIRGDFKKQVIKPTAINFSIEKTDLILDATISDNPTMGNGRVHSFTIKAEPANTTVTECTLKLSAPLITFVKWDTDKWIENNTTTFHLNEPIYFVVNNVVDNFTGNGYEIEEDYYDGVLIITVKDKSGLLQDTLQLEIDRSVTSISFKDQYKDINNRITNGLFDYELRENYDNRQKLEAIEREDYPLEIITAPLKASKPFNTGDREAAKISEMYFVKDGQPRLVIRDGAVVKLQRYDDQGNIVEDECSFLTYDNENGRYIFNSAESGDFEFLLATYPTYDIQEKIEGQQPKMSFIERLQSVEEDGTPSMLTKRVVITVNGTEADNVEFGGDLGSISMNLLQDNIWIANNPTTLDKYDLGLTLSKNESGTGINSRYNELKFLTEDDFVDGIVWTFKRKVDNNGVFEDSGEQVTISFTKNLNNIYATINGLVDYIDNTVQYGVELIKNAEGYRLILTHVNPENNEDFVTITFELQADEYTNKALVLVEDVNGLEQAVIKKSNEQNSATIYMDLQIGNCFVLGDVIEEQDGVTIYNFKTLKDGVYLAILGKYAEDTLLNLINDKFITSINHNGADTEIVIKPIDADVQDVKLYAIVVNSNGTYHYTSNYREMVVNTIHSSIQVLDNELNVPVVVGESVIYDSMQFNAQGNGGLFAVSGGSYTQGLLFTPRYTRLDMENAPDEWGFGLEVYVRNGNVYTKVDKVEGYVPKTYWVKNNFKTIDIINYTQNETTYYLVGYVENNSFVNKVVPTSDGPNYYSKLYPAVIKSKYLTTEGRLQTSEEVVNQILTGKQGTSVLVNDGSEITYDLSLLPNRKIAKTSNLYYVQTSDMVYNSNKTYYEFIDGVYVAKTITEEDADKWATIKGNLFEYLALDICSAESMFGEAFETNDAGWIYYTKNAYQIALDKVGEYSSINWASYYVIVDHYLIKSCIENGENVEIEAYPYAKKIDGQCVKIDKIQTFVISKASYQAEIENKFNIDIIKFFADEHITVNSYYAFSAEESVKPQVSFGGTYFENEQTKGEGFYTIIAGHKNIIVDWDGINAGNTDNAIGAKVAKTSISIAHKEKGGEILNNIVRDLRVHAIEYDSNNNYVGLFTSIEIGEISTDYLPAGEQYDENNNYYVLINDSYQLLEVTEEVINAWADNYTTYYIYGISVPFNVTGEIINNHYIKFEWVYSGGNGEYKVYSPQLRILSNQLTGYNIDITQSIENADKVYTIVATKVDQVVDGENPEQELENLYKYVNGNYEKVEAGYEGDCYVLGVTEFDMATEVIKYQLYVSYNNGYTYIVYAVNEASNYLYYLDEDTGKYIAVTASVDTAFKLKSQGGWIAPNPVYAQQPNFVIQDNENIRLQKLDESEESVVEVVKALVSSGFTDVVLKSTDEAIQKTIKVQVVADSKFTHEVPGTKESSILELPNGNMFKYGEEIIDMKLDATISNFSIVRNGETVTDRYTISSDKKQIVLKTGADNNDAFVKIMYNETSRQWVLTRTNYDNITLNVDFESVLGVKSVTFVFSSPYQIVKSATNDTGVIYSGTKFILAQNKVENDASQIDTLFKFIKISEGVITIKHDLMTEGDRAIGTVENGNTYEFEVPTVTKPTNCSFTVYFNDGKADSQDVAIDSFGLTIKPNILISEDVSDLIRLDDVNNNTYDFSSLKVSSYAIKNSQDDDIKYYSYTLDKDEDGVYDGLNTIVNPTLSYKIATFTDSGFTNTHTTNIATEDSKKLIVAPISKVGTYYINVQINSGEVNVGEVNFIVESISQVKDKDNGDVDALTTTAQTETQYTISELQELFNLSQNGEKAHYFVDNWVKTTEFKENETYTYDAEAQKYILLTQAPATGENVEMWRNDRIKTYIELSDILWINNTNGHLEITYKYTDVTLTQNLDKLTYEGKTYDLIGTSFNMGDFIFDISDNCFKKVDGTALKTQMFGDNIAYYMHESNSVIYCKQNAYLFENGNEILAMSIDNAGKTLYKFVKQVDNSYFTETNNNNENMYFKKVADGKYTLIDSTEQVAVKYKLNVEPSAKAVGAFEYLSLLYNSFGQDLATDEDVIDVIDYKVDLVFDYNNYKYTIATDDVYNINVYPMKLGRNEYTVVKEYLTNDTKYKLYGEYTRGDAPLFKVHSRVTKVEFGAGDGYIIENQQYIKFTAQGNNYTISLPITLTYDDGTTYKYHEDINVVNSVVVDIKYPYNVNNSYSTEYGVFNASINELSNSIGSLYQINDFANWLGADNATFAYDLALRSDTINLAEEDDLQNTKRFNAYRYLQIRNEFVADGNTTYYCYNKETSKFEVVELVAGSTYFGNIYFTRVDSNETISNIELVATSSTYAIDDDIVKSWFACNGNTIVVKSPTDKAEDETLNLTGYVAFKVYAGTTGAYGYYVLKVVADEQFDRVIAFGESRNTQTISKKISDNQTTLKTIFNTTSYKIHSVAGISSDLIDYNNYSNVYLFKVDSNDVQGAINSIENGQYIPIDTALTPYNTIQTIEVAVVVRNGTSLVHVCNYEIILQPNIDVEIITDIIEQLDENRYEYSLKSGQEFMYDYLNLNNNNYKNLSSYFTVMKDSSKLSLRKVEFEDADWLNFEQDRIYYEDAMNKVVAQITSTTINDETTWQLNLIANVSERAEIKLKLTYEAGTDSAEIYLTIVLNPFEFNETTEIEINAGANGENELDLTKIFGDYKGKYEYTIQNSLGGVIKESESNSNTDTTIKDFENIYYQETIYYITVKLLNVYKNITFENIAVKIKPNITGEYNGDYDGYSSTGKRVTPIKVETETLSQVGSKLNVDIKQETNVTTIKLGDTDNPVFTIEAKGTCSIEFSLTNDSGEELKLNGNSYQYFVGSTTLPSTESLQYLQFVHSAMDINARLNIKVKGSDTYSTTYVLYITIPKTYELSTIYRVEGATFETVKNDSELILKADEDTTDIKEHFFGETDAIYVNATTYSASKTYYNAGHVKVTPTNEDITDWDNAKANYYEKVVNEARVAIKVGDKYYYGYDNIYALGMFDINNPNRLSYSLTTTGENDTSSINNGILTFVNSNNNESTILNISNSTSVSITYQFKIFNEESDYSNIVYNSDLLQIDETPNNDSVDLDYIVIPYSQFKNGAIDLAYLEYDPTVENQIARVVMIEKSSNSETDGLTYNFVRDIGAVDYVSRLVIEKTVKLLSSEVYEIEFIIITVNGVASKVTLVIANFDAEYGYHKSAQSYEYVYGGTEIGKLTDKDNNGNTRLTTTIDGFGIGQSYVLIQEAEWAELSADKIYKLNGSEYENVGTTKPTDFTANTYYKHIDNFALRYKDTVNGLVTQWRLGDNLPTTNLAQYDRTNGNIFLLNVAQNTAVTLVFDVVYDGRIVVGRVFYQLIIQNNLRIGVNPALKQGVIDLYLGSEIYSRGKFDENSTEDDATIIDLLQSQETKDGQIVYNNLFVTLEQYSTGNTIERGEALYNGNTNSELNTGSKLSSDVVSDYLRFDFGEMDKSLEGKMRFVGHKLYIKGNPSGSFVLKVSAANETEYGISKTININKYDYTQAQYSESVNVKNGDGYASGETINLFKDIGTRKGSGDTQKGDYAFASYRLGNGLTDKVALPLLSGEGITISYKTVTFDYGTSVAEIKQSNRWSAETDKPITSSNASDGLYPIELPSVKSAQYQIVSYKLTINYNGDSSNEYYAHYLVENLDQIKINKFYEDNDKVITYNEGKTEDNPAVGAWQSETTLTIMDTKNQGLYSALTQVTSDTQPTDWTTGGIYYKKDGTTGVYTKINTSTEVYNKNNCYKLNTIASEYSLTNHTQPQTGVDYYTKENGLYVKATGIDDSFAEDVDYYVKNTDDKNIIQGYRAYIIKDGEYVDDNGYPLTYTNNSDEISITMELPTKNKLGEYLFTNKADIKIIIRANDGGANVVEDEWTIQAGTTIEPKDTKPLRDFFLLSEIGQDLYQNCEIIGLVNQFTSDTELTVAKGFLKDNGVVVDRVVWGDPIKTITTTFQDNGTEKECTYNLYEVCYVGSSGSDVFTLEAKYYVLVGHSTAMSFTFNAGSDYFINLTIDKSNIKEDNSATIKLADFVKIWIYNTDSTKYDGKIGFVEDTTTLSLGLDVTTDSNKVIDDKIYFEDNIITISGIDSITQNEFVTVTIKSGDISRKIQLYFNIVINAKDIENIGTEETPVYAMPYNEMLASAMVGRTELSNSDINSALKTELLSLIKFNDKDVVNNGVVDNITFNRYSISVKDVTGAGYYEITYTYTSQTATYIRTLKISSVAPNIEE